MAYKVLARKYRSWTFDELVGQEAIGATLKQSIESGRLHHGYLFCGTRGVGKTSAARILARSLNCLKSEGPTTQPCRMCESCVAIAEGQDIDVIEIDAASNTGVDNIRELRSNANYRPARSRFKIYIIDEVHMLSTGAFNALLKTLEEPPEHVKFVLATTDPQKVPPTIQSRCLRFDFKSIPPERIAEHFTAILEEEGIKAEPSVLRRVARLANGSMRDGLSLLDQLLSLGTDALTPEMLDDVLPVAHDEVLIRLVGQLADHDAAGALMALDHCLAAGYTLERFTEALAEQMRALMLLRVCGADTILVESPASVREELVALSQRFEAESYVHMIAVMEELRRNVRFSGLGRALVEAALVRLADAVRYRSVQKLLEELEGAEETPAVGEKKKSLAESSRAGEPASSTPATPAGRAPAAASAASARPATPMPETGSGVASSQDKPPAQRGAPVPARVPAESATHRRQASTEDVRHASNDPLVREAMDLFNGSLVNVERLQNELPEHSAEEGKDKGA